MGRPIPRSARRQRLPFAQRTAQTQDIVAPIGGKNTRDSLGAMPITDAVIMENWIPAANGLTSRTGSAIVSNDYSTSVETVISYINGSTSTLITAEDGNLWTDDGADTTASLGSGFTNDRWFAAKIAANMVLVNGADAPRNFDGSTLTTPTFTGDLATYGEENIDGITTHKNRMYMWDSGYGNFFYGGVNSVSGAFSEFNLNRVSATGGNLLEVKTISRDGGSGPDDYVAFILSTGEILVYQGSDPGDASNWSLVGRYQAPPLIAKNCAYGFGGDVLMLTKVDLIKLSDVIKYTTEDGGLNLRPSKLSGDIKDDFTNYGTNYGWQVTAHPDEGWIIINVPETVDSKYHQHVVDTVTGGYTTFTGWDARQFVSHNGNLYFGGATDLWQGATGFADNGADIQCIAQGAFSNLAIAKRKAVKNVRTYMESEATLNIDLQIAYDFNDPDFQGTQSSASEGATWDAEDWDDASWAGVSARQINFVTAGEGVFVSTRAKVDVNGQKVIWYQSTYNFEILQTY